MTIVPLGTYLLYMLPMFILQVAVITALAMLISSVSANSAVSVSVSVILFVAAFLFLYQLKMLRTVAPFLLFSYINIPSLLNGEAALRFVSGSVTYLTGAVVCIASGLLFYAAAWFAFRRKDILS